MKSTMLDTPLPMCTIKFLRIDTKQRSTMHIALLTFITLLYPKNCLFICFHFGLYHNIMLHVSIDEP